MAGSRANWEAILAKGKAFLEGHPEKNVKGEKWGSDKIPGDKDSTVDKIREHKKKMKEMMEE